MGNQTSSNQQQTVAVDTYESYTPNNEFQIIKSFPEFIKELRSKSNETVAPGIADAWILFHPFEDELQQMEHDSDERPDTDPTVIVRAKTEDENLFFYGIMKNNDPVYKQLVNKEIIVGDPLNPDPFGHTLLYLFKTELVVCFLEQTFSKGYNAVYLPLQEEDAKRIGSHLIELTKL